MHASYLLASTAVAAAIALSGTQLLAGGDKMAYGNPTGDPAEDTYQNPYASQGDGRLLIYCEEGETLVIVPVETGMAEATCQPAE
jgi:hypothetical protein